jgi:PKD repeat protein
VEQLKPKTMKNTAIKISLFALSFGTFLMPASAQNLTDALKIKIVGNNYSDETVIRFNSAATPNFDGNWDAWKIFSSNAAVPEIFTRIDSLSPLSINAYSPLNRKFTFEIFTKITNPGIYTIRGLELGAFASTVCIRLEDMQTNTFYNLRDTTAYSFNLSYSSVNCPPRFRVIFSPQVAVLTAPTTCSTTSDGMAAVAKLENYSWSYVAYDANSNVVASNPNVNQYDTISSLLPGTYTLSVTTSFGCHESHAFTVGSPPPVEAQFFTYDTISYYSSPFAGFYNLSQNADSYLWNFGDGSLPDMTYSPSHWFPDTGNFVVSLTVVGINGQCSDTYTKTITVLPDTFVYANPSPNMNPSFIAFGQKENEVIMLRLNDLPPGQPVLVEFYASNGSLISKSTQLDGDNSMTFVPPSNGVYIAVVHIGDKTISKSTSFIR